MSVAATSKSKAARPASQDSQPPTPFAQPALLAPVRPARRARLQILFWQVPAAPRHHKSGLDTHATTLAPSGPVLQRALPSSAFQKPLLHAGHRDRAAPPIPTRTTRVFGPDIWPRLFERKAPPLEGFSLRFAAPHPSTKRLHRHRWVRSLAAPL